MTDSTYGESDSAAIDPVVELVELLCQRHEVLDQLAEGPKTKRDLVGELDVSRSTVDRAIRSLTTAGLVRSNGNTYEQSLSGRLTATAFTDCLVTLTAVSRAQELLALLPPSAPVDPEFVRFSEVITGDGAAQTYPHDFVTERVQAAEQLCGFVHTHSNPRTIPVFREELEQGMNTELVFENDVFDHLTSRYTEQIADLFALDVLSVWRTDSVPFGLFISEEREATRVTILLYNDRSLRGVLSSQHPAAVTWARDLFADVRSDAIPVEPAHDGEKGDAEE